MNILAQLWDKVSGTQPVPPSWLIGASAAVALVIVLNNRTWRLTGHVITIAHEGGHALISLLTGRRLEGIRLHSDISGVTYSRGRTSGPGIVLCAAAGYITPSLLGAGAALLIAAGHLTAMLWLALALLAATLIVIRNAFGAVAVLLTAAGVFAVSWFGSVNEQAGFAYLAAWFLLLGALRPVIDLQRGRRAGRARRSDADQLARLTGVPGGVWVTVFAVFAIAAMVLGARLLIPGGVWHGLR